jgi:hypothetical protein
VTGLTPIAAAADTWLMTTASKGRKRNNPVQPTCPQCSEPMKLERTALFKGYPGIEDRTYKCSKCSYSEGWVVSESNPKTERVHRTHN